MKLKENKSFFGIVLRLLVYLLGLGIIALGINVSKLAGLGISPVSSIPGVLSAKFPSFSLGNMVIIVYCVLVLAQLVVLGKKFRVKNILGVPVALVFGLLVDFVGTAPYKLKLAGIDLGIEKEFNGLLVNFPAPGALIGRILYLVASILIIGIGVTVYLSPDLVPMPAEGLAGAISEKYGKLFGNCKSGVDFGMIFIAAVLQVVFMGFASLGTGLIPDIKGVVGIGTVLSALCVGQVVKILRKLFK